MTKRNGRDYLYVIWKDMKTRGRFIVGELSKNGNYEFRYDSNRIKLAIENGFELFVAFPDQDKIYENSELFPAFSSRLPDRRRKDINEILNSYKLEKYDAYELLRKSGGKLPTDTIEFIDPIFLEEESICREFYIAGTSHSDLCEGHNRNANVFNPDLCKVNVQLHEGELLCLKLHPDNEFDSYAIEVFSVDGLKLGYIPTYYSEAVSKALYENRNAICRVKMFKNNGCQECILAEIEITK